MDDDIQLAGLHHLQRQQQAAAGVTSRSAAIDTSSPSGNAGATGASTVTVGLARQLSATHSTKTSSEPDIRGVAMAQAMAQAQAQASSIRRDFNFETAESSTANNDSDFLKETNDSPYQGLDLNYILSGSNPAGSGAGVDLGVGGAGALGGFDPVYAWGSRISVAAEGAAAPGGAGLAQHGHGWALGWAMGPNMGRRQSTATVDDTFLKYVFSSSRVN